MNTNTTIHCKICFNGQIRRFALQSTEFTSLKEIITRLFALNGEFVLKYKDDESDYVNLDTQDELRTALTLSPNLLRLLVEVPKNSTSVSSTSSDDCHWKMYRKRHGCGKDWKEKDHCGKDSKDWKDHHGKRHCHKDWKDHCRKQDRKSCRKSEKFQCRKEHAEKILAYIDQCLAEIPASDSSPQTLYKKQKLERKKLRIESWIKGDCSQRRREAITPEEEQHNLTIKNQILGLKEQARKIKERQREIKMMLQEKEDKALIEELTSLKEQKKLLRIQKKALIDQLHI